MAFCPGSREDRRTDMIRRVIRCSRRRPAHEGAASRGPCSALVVKIRCGLVKARGFSIRPGHTGLPWRIRAKIFAGGHCTH